MSEQPKDPDRERVRRSSPELPAGTDPKESHDAEGHLTGHLTWEGMDGLILYDDDAKNLREYGKTKAQIIAEHEGLDGSSAPD
jgi:hypothetical protein